ncbi:MAG: GNAT family N-acetyltransferase, partial [Bacteroidetes bacterium]|nr:GNAT family N-acetyltransferase [Bacteroidota bacterium]
MTNLDTLLFQKINLDGVRTLVKWAEEEGWNPGPFDADVYYATDPDGFYGYYDNDTLIAGGAIVSYNNEFGFMGLFIVKPEFRGKEIGRNLVSTSRYFAKRIKQRRF